MAGTSEGGKRARDKNKATYGPDYYREIGRLGGIKGKTGGFWHRKYVLGDTESIRRLGQAGGRIGGRAKRKEQE